MRYDLYPELRGFCYYKIPHAPSFGFFPKGNDYFTKGNFLLNEVITLQKLPMENLYMVNFPQAMIKL